MQIPNSKAAASGQSRTRKKDKGTTPPTLAKRRALRDDFFRNQINSRQLLEAFDQVPGVRYFVKDAQSRLMALSSKRLAHLGLASEEDVIGLTDRDYLPAEIVDSFLADDQWVIQHGKPLRNRVEMGIDEKWVPRLDHY